MNGYVAPNRDPRERKRKRNADSDSEDEASSLEESDVEDELAKNENKVEDEPFMFYYEHRDALVDVCESGQIPMKQLKELLATTFGFGETKALQVIHQLCQLKEGEARKHFLNQTFHDHFSVPTNRQITLYPIQPSHMQYSRKRSTMRPYAPAPQAAPTATPGAAGVDAGPPAAAAAAVMPGAVAAHHRTPAASPVPAAVDTGPRGEYKCRKCGQLKKGHRCLA